MRLVHTNGGDPDFVLLCQKLEEELNRLAGGAERRAAFNPHNQLEDIQDVVIAYEGGIPIGAAGLKRYEADCAEVKRVFVRPESRGRGISRQLLNRLEQVARERGYRCLRLESTAALKAAMGLYHSMGYQIIPNYGPYREIPISICMEKLLG